MLVAYIVICVLQIRLSFFKLVDSSITRLAHCRDKMCLSQCSFGSNQDTPFNMETKVELQDSTY